MTGCPFELIAPPESEIPNPDSLLQPHSVVRVPRAHVGEDDPLAGFETLDDLNRRNRALPELHFHADGLVAVPVHAEDGNLALFLAERRPPHVNDVGEPVELD